MGAASGGASPLLSREGGDLPGLSVPVCGLEAESVFLEAPSRSPLMFHSCALFSCDRVSLSQGMAMDFTSIFFFLLCHHKSEKKNQAILLQRQ